LKTYLVRELEQRLGGSFDIGRLHYRLWMGEIGAEHVSFAAPPDGLPLAIDVQSLTADWGPFSGLSIRLVKPDVRLGPSGSGKPGKETPEEMQRPFLPAWVDAIDIVDGRFELNDTDGEVLLLERTDLHVRKRLDRHRGHLRIRAGRVDLPEEKVRIEEISGDLTLNRDELDLRGFRLTTEDSRFTVNGTVTGLSPLNMEADIGYRVDASIARHFYAQNRGSGAIEGNASLKIAGENWAIRGDLSTSDLAWSEWGPLVAKGRFDVTPHHVDVPSLKLSGYQGTLSATASIGLAPSDTQQLDIQIDGVSLEALTEDLENPQRRLASRLNGQIDLRVEAWSLATANGQGVLNFQAIPGSPGVPLESHVHLVISSGDFHVGVEASSPTPVEGTLSVDGGFADGEVLEARFRGRMRGDGTLEAPPFYDTLPASSTAFPTVSFGSHKRAYLRTGGASPLRAGSPSLVTGRHGNCLSRLRSSA
jgi:hypothetical protein